MGPGVNTVWLEMKGLLVEKISYEEAISIVEMTYCVEAIRRGEVEVALSFFLPESPPVPGWHCFNDADIFTSMGVESSGDVLIISEYSYMEGVAFLVGCGELFSMVSSYVESYSERLFNNGDVLFFLLKDRKVVFVHHEGVYSVVPDVDIEKAVTAYRSR